MTFSLPRVKGESSSCLRFHANLQCSTASQLEFPAGVWFLPKMPLPLHVIWIARVTDLSSERNTGSGVGWGVYGKQAMQSNSLSLKSLRTPVH